jgi:hypothetical protein
MLPFDLELAKQGHPVCFRDGTPCRILSFECSRPGFPIVAEYPNEYPKLSPELFFYSKEGYWECNPWSPLAGALYLASTNEGGDDTGR